MSEEINALRLVADLRFALGDNGKRMQPELIEYAKGIVSELATLRRRVAELEGGICILLGIIASSGAELDRFEMSSLRQVREVLESNAKQPAPATEKHG